jgi:hypothetical protein
MAGGSNTVAVTVVVTPAAVVHQPGHTPTTHHPGHLAWTGSPIDTLTALATATLIAGTFLLTAFRRRAHRPTSWGTS